MANAQFQFQFVYLPFFSHKRGAENIGREERKQRKMGKGGLTLCSWDASSREKAKRLGLVFSERCRDHCPRRELKQVNQQKATEKGSSGREEKEEKEQKVRR